MSTSHQAPGRPLLSIIIVNFNTRGILKECLNRIKDHSGDIDREIILVDNASTDGSSDMVRKDFPEVILIESKRNLGFAGGNNLGIHRAQGRYLLLLNSDAYLLPDTLSATISFMEKTPDCGILGVKLIDEKGDMQPSARMLPDPWRKFLVISGIADRFSGSKWFGGPDFSWWPHNSPRDVGWVPGAFFLIRKAVVDAIGGMDEQFFLYFEETDYCLQAARTGWRVMIFPEVSVIHLGGESSKTAQEPMSDKGKQILQYQFQSEYIYYRKNYSLFHVAAASGVEILWNMAVIVKNLILYRRGSSHKINSSLSLITMMFRTLREGRFGKR